MGQVLGLGVTHFPPLSGPDENLGRILKRALEDPAKEAEEDMWRWTVWATHACAVMFQVQPFIGTRALSLRTVLMPVALLRERRGRR